MFFLIGGVVSDRFERRRVMMLANAIRFCTMLAIGILAVTGAVELWHLWILMALSGVGDSLFQPAFQAIVPDVVPDDILVEANSLGGLVRPAALQLMGPAIGGLLVGGFGSGPAFIINSSTFAVSYVTLWLMASYPIDKTGAPAQRSIVAEIKEGFAFVRAHAWLWATLASAAVSLLMFIGPLEVVVPFIVKNELGGSASAYGLVLASGGVGAIIGAVVMGQKGLPKKHITFMYYSWVIGVLLLAGYAFLDSIWQVMILQGVIGACFSVGIIVWVTLMHRLVPRDLLGRVSSLDWLVSTCLVPISFGLAGPVAEAIGPQATMLWGGVLGAALMIVFLYIPGVRATERDGSLSLETSTV
jgi:DHA3 family tetracycline resistance protein-like MFS transporter